MEDCAICMCSMPDTYVRSVGLSIRKLLMSRCTLPCGHAFHRACFEKLDRNYKKQRQLTTCPMCRAQLNWEAYPHVSNGKVDV